MRKGKLRLVVDWGNIIVRDGLVFRRPFERLECGHVIRQPSDIFGYTNATWRRCRKCKSGLATDPKIEDREYSLGEANALLYGRQTKKPP